MATVCSGSRIRSVPRRRLRYPAPYKNVISIHVSDVLDLHEM